jgi:hypothetical protein
MTFTCHFNSCLIILSTPAVSKGLTIPGFYQLAFINWLLLFSIYDARQIFQTNFYQQNQWSDVKANGFRLAFQRHFPIIQSAKTVFVLPNLIVRETA